MSLDTTQYFSEGMEVQGKEDFKGFFLKNGHLP